LIKQAIILAGGLGTRLKSTVQDLPKCLAPVGGRPFLFYLINYLRSQSVEEFIFSLGYMKELVVQYLYEDFPTLNYKLSIEDEPLGTGGAIRLAMDHVTEEDVLVANGDTFYKIDVAEITHLHLQKKATATLALKPMENFDRYGLVELNEDSSIRSFREKQFYLKGLINGGVYLINKNKFCHTGFSKIFSFEKDFLGKQPGNIYGCIQDGYFIDIGIPQDYYRADKDFRKPVLDLKTIDSCWTLFLDRDGVINYEKPDGYILNWQEFKFYEGSKEAIGKLSRLFGHIIIVSNQRGVGRGFMTEDDLKDIHDKMRSEIEAAGGKIDNIYYCTSIDNKHPDRKPNPGMAFKAKKEIPGIDPDKAIIVGNKLSDMKFGRNAGLYTVYIRSTHPEQSLPHPEIDLAFDTLADFATACLLPSL
jgi:D-glycero-alpha-D-manno-heptose 1-phosphate guanylyltransferase